VSLSGVTIPGLVTDGANVALLAPIPQNFFFGFSYKALKALLAPILENFFSGFSLMGGFPESGQEVP